MSRGKRGFPLIFADAAGFHIFTNLFFSLYYGKMPGRRSPFPVNFYA